jgi:predicted TIM-barrel fold metal-dependent hydrolase
VEKHGFDVIDVHHHYEAGYGVGDALDLGRKGDDAGKAEIELTTRLSTMDVEHVRGAIIIAGHTYLRPRGLADTAAVNDAVAAYRDQLPGRFVAAVGVVEPLYGEAGHSEVARCKEELGLAGISFHNAFQGTPADSPLMLPLIEQIGESGLVPFVHAYGSQLETLHQVDSLAGHFPDLTMVVLDTFHDINQVKALPEVAERRPNLYFDLALLVNFETLGLPVVRSVGADRFVYGTDQYSWPMSTKPYGSLLPGIVSSDLADEDKARIFGGNIKGILGL